MSYHTPQLTFIHLFMMCMIASNNMRFSYRRSPHQRSCFPEPNGSNLATFSLLFQVIGPIGSRHLEGTSTLLVLADASKRADNEADELVRWDRNEAVAHYMLLQRLPDSTDVSLKTTTRRAGQK